MSRQKKRKGMRLLGVFLFFFIGLLGWFIWSVGAGNAVARTITIEGGMGADNIAKYLEKEGIVRSRIGFNIYGYATRTRHRLQPGTYAIPAGADVGEIIAILTSGANTREHTVRIIEGWTIAEIDAYLAKERLYDMGVFKDAASAVRKQCVISSYACSVIASLPKKTESLEGYLFPDTYRLFADASPEDLIEKMLVRFGEKTKEKKFQKMLHNSGFTFHDVVTMASIIEAEVPHLEDRAIVSGLLWKRIDAGMPLQVDSTINYVTGKHTPSVSYIDLKIDSPYNTYLYPDLPPAPIGNPGIEALTAAVSPKESPYWFYLSAPDGTTIFSKTFAEHKAAKVKYLR